MDINELIIGIDIGGTKIAAGLVNKKGDIIEKKKVSTDLSGEKAILYQVKDIIKAFLQQSNYKNIAGIGIGLPGTVDQENGIAVKASNLPYKSLALGPELSSYFSLPVYLENDGDAGTLGEKWFGKGKGKNKFIYFTVGTGIGAGIIAGDNLIRGCEIGHTIVKPEGPVCKCGSKGCLEAVASGPAIAR
ncbi:MAG: ROK family protein, partial [bacterium]